jgi:hypothetical protein
LWLVSSVSNSFQQYEYVYEYVDIGAYGMMKAATTVFTIPLTITYTAAAELSDYEISLLVQETLTAAGVAASVITGSAPVVPSSPSVHTAHSVHAPPTPHLPPATPHDASVHSMGPPVDNMAMGGTVHEAMGPVVVDDMGMDMDMDVAHQVSVHPPTPHAGMPMAKATFSTTIYVVVSSSGDVTLVNSLLTATALSAALGVPVTALTISTPTTFSCSSLGPLSEVCPVTRTVAFCEEVGRNLLCLTGPPTVPASDTDATCAFDLTTLAGLTNYYDSQCSASA